MVNGNPNSTNAPAAKSAAVIARDSTDSIVVAFILAFIFRAFIVEAFVIPTGSMAPTLYGQQVTHTCSTCGYEYARGAELLQTGISQPMEFILQCPNCASTADKLPRSELNNPSSGDRILVQKWTFSAGGPLGPERWGVTVFKDPQNGTINFIKRLVGMPGEFLQIIHGDVYAARFEDIRKGNDADLIQDAEQLRLDVYRHGHEGPMLDLRDVQQRYDAINARLIPYLKIQRKAVEAPVAQKALWFNVHDHNFLPNYDSSTVRPEARVGWSALIISVDSPQPEQLNSGQIPQDLRKALAEQRIHLPENPAVVIEEANSRWRVASPAGDLLVVHDQGRLAVYEAAAATAWHTSGRELRFKSDSERTLSVRFTGKLIDDFYAYNFVAHSRLSSQHRVPVGDLRLRFIWFPESGDGGLALQMNRDTDTFIARIQMDGTAQVERLADGARKSVLIGKVKLDSFTPGKAVAVEFTNVDFRVSLGINDQEVIASNDNQYSPNLADLLRKNPEDPDLIRPSQVWIGAHKMECRIAHVRLDRDEYYRSNTILDPQSSPQPDQSLKDFAPVINPYREWPGWATQGWPIMLREGQVNEYFMLGDNSPGSKDSRLWWEIGPHLLHLGEEYQIGTVPEDQLIGGAFFVYWPSGYRRAWSGSIGIVPNFGRMRWIR